VKEMIFCKITGKNDGKGTVYKFVLFPIVQMFFILYALVAALLYSPTICSYLVVFVFFSFMF